MTAELNQMELATGLVGGLALFLFGMDIMTRALKQVAGATIRTLLARMTGNRFLGLFAGASLTAVIQSSSVTTVLLVGFISAGLMTTGQSVAVIFGANIGTTMTVQILAFKVSALALPLLSLGIFVSLIARRKVTREYGRIVLGLGMIFFGMTTMSDAMSPLRSYQPFVAFMLSLDNLGLAVLMGAAFTALVQSSAATIGILLVLVGQRLIGLEPAIALALGANIGTCVTAVLAALGKPRAAVRAALVHVLFNVAGVVIWIFFVDDLAALARLFGSAVGMSDANLPRQLANVHTFVKVADAALFIGFTTQITRLVEWLVPDRPDVPEPDFAPKHLDPDFLGVPAIAIDAVRLEIGRLAVMVRDMTGAACPAVMTGSPIDLDRLHVMDRPVDLLHRAIVGYIRRISLSSLPADQSRLLVALVRIANDLEHIGDHVSAGLVATARKRIDENVVISPTTAGVIAALHREVVEALDGVITALDTQDAVPADHVRQMKAGFTALIEDIAGHEIGRLYADEPRRLQTYAREIELTETLDDIFKIVRRIARTEMMVFARSEPAAAQ